MIDPESIATIAMSSSTLTSVLSLIGQFKSGRDAASGASYNDFMIWLTKSNHHEIKSLIETNQLTTVGISPRATRLPSERCANKDRCSCRGIREHDRRILRTERSSQPSG